MHRLPAKSKQRLPAQMKEPIPSMRTVTPPRMRRCPCSWTAQQLRMLQGSSSADDSATNAEPYEQKKCGRKDCERWRHDERWRRDAGDRCCEPCLITSGEQHDIECRDRQAVRQALCEWCCSQRGIEPLPDLRSIEMHGFRPLTRISRLPDIPLTRKPWTFAEGAQMPEMRTPEMRAMNSSQSIYRTLTYSQPFSPCS